MHNLLIAIPTGITAFIATNLDDIIILLLLFSQVNRVFQRRHVVIGQYLGFTALLLMSMPGFLGGQLFPQSWIGMLGLVPIAIGINRLLHRDEDEDNCTENLTVPQSTHPLAGFLSPQACSIAAITIANGGDNLGIYMPLFASCTLASLLVILSVFLSLVGVWCYAAFQLTRVPMIAETLTRYGNLLVPFVLIGLGVMILIESHTLEDQSLTILSLIVSAISMVMINRRALLPQKN